MRLVALTIAALTLSSTASHPGGRSSTPDTSLTIVALNASVGRAVFHLSCVPAGGDLPDPMNACATLNQQPELVTSPEPFVCRGGPQSHWLVQLSGWLKGQAIRRSFSTCWTLQAPMIQAFALTWDVLRKHLVPRRHKSVRPGTTRRFPPDVLRATDLVTCRILGYHLEVGVPVAPGGRVTVGYGGTYPVVTLTVAYNRDRSVTASCHSGRR
jgi:hypothetical protein